MWMRASMPWRFRTAGGSEMDPTLAAILLLGGFGFALIAGGWLASKLGW